MYYMGVAVLGLGTEMHYYSCIVIVCQTFVSLGFIILYLFIACVLVSLY